MSRACGSRTQDALYIEVETSPTGLPIEAFLLDPAPMWSGDVPLRSPMLVESKENDCAHMILGVGENNYPTAPDFVEEAREIGVSKRVPRDFDFSRLVRGKSRLILMHPKTIPIFDSDRPSGGGCPRMPDEEHECIFKLWNLATLEPSSDKHKIVDKSKSEIGIEIPCGRVYHAHKPTYPDVTSYQTHYSQSYKPGLFISLPLHRFVYINKDGTLPTDIKESAEATEWDVVVCEEW